MKISPQVRSIAPAIGPATAAVVLGVMSGVCVLVLWKLRAWCAGDGRAFDGGMYTPDTASLGGVFLMLFVALMSAVFVLGLAGYSRVPRRLPVRGRDLFAAFALGFLLVSVVVAVIWLLATVHGFIAAWLRS